MPLVPNTPLAECPVGILCCSPASPSWGRRLVLGLSESPACAYTCTSSTYVDTDTPGDTGTHTCAHEPSNKNAHMRVHMHTDMRA